MNRQWQPVYLWAIVILAGLFRGGLAPGEELGLPRPAVPDGFGVNIHFTDPQPGEMERFAEAGYRLARMDLSWSRVEREKGVYDFSAFDRLLDHLDGVGARALLILDYGNRLYDDGMAPHSDAGRTAFARYAAAAAKRYKSRGVLWEIWNEPNLSQFWKPEPDAENYAALAIETAKAIRAVDPEAIVMAPGSSGFPWAFFETTFKAGLLEHLDAVSVHPYRSEPPETAAEDYARLRALIARYAPTGMRDLPIVSSEWGYTTADARGVVTEDQQARYLVRQWLSNLASGVNLSIFYDWKDDGPDPKEREHRFGTVRQDLTPKPSFLAAKALIEALDGYSYCHRLTGDENHDWRLLFQRGRTDDLAVVSWSTSPDAPEAAQMPSVRKVEPSDPDFPELRMLAAIQFAAGPRPVWLDSPAVLNMEVRHPGGPGTASLDMTIGESGGLAASLGLGTGANVTPRLLLPINAPEDEINQVPLRILWNRRPLPLAPLTIVCVDPIRLVVAPRANDLAVIVENPSALPSRGLLVMYSGETALAFREIRVEEGTERQTVSLPRFDGPYELKLTTATGVLAARIGPRRNQPMDGFPVAPSEDSAFGAVLHVDNHGLTPEPLSFMEEHDEEAPAPVSLVVPYLFDPGWRYLTVMPDAGREIPEEAGAIQIWVHGDGSGNPLRCRFRDASGQVFQVDLTAIDWNGWQPVTIPLDGSGKVTHWGGTDDGVIHGARTWEALVLIDSARQAESKTGEIRLAGAVYILK